MEKKITFFNAIRDLLLYILPIDKFSPKVIKSLYGFSPDFIFLAHPRNMEDMYNMIPFLKLWSRFLPESFILKFASFWPAGVVTDVQWNDKAKGFIVSTPMLPETLFKKREYVSKAILKIVKFIRKLSHNKVYVGLAGWWPIVSNRGLAFKRALKENDSVVVTNGHTATLLSLFLTINTIGRIASLPLDKMKIAIIGVGKMGKAMVELLNGRVDSIGLFDTNQVWLDIVSEKAKSKSNASTINKYSVSGKQFDEDTISRLREYQIAICTTSNIEPIIKDVEALKDIVVIDDSRPEAFPRIVDLDKKVLVLEGGLVKLKGIMMGADFGFSKEDNVFGCMAEAIVLALDKEKKVVPILGDISFDNLKKMTDFFKDNDITEGDLKSGQQNMDNETLCRVLE